MIPGSPQRRLTVLRVNMDMIQHAYGLNVVTNLLSSVDWSFSTHSHPGGSFRVVDPPFIRSLLVS